MTLDLLMEDLGRLGRKAKRGLFSTMMKRASGQGY